MCKLCVCNSDFENGRTDGRRDRASARSPIGLNKNTKYNILFHFSQYLVYSGEGNVVKDELEELGETQPVLSPHTEAGDGLAVQLALPETGSGSLRE